LAKSVTQTMVTAYCIDLAASELLHSRYSGVKTDLPYDDRRHFRWCQ